MPIPPDKGTPMEQAETRTDQANLRTDQANTRTDEANARTEQANTRTAEANTRTEQADLRTEKAETQTETLRDSEINYRRLFESARDGILILDADTGHIADVNPFLVELLGYSHGEMVGKTVGELSPFKDILSNQAMLERLQRDGYIRYDDQPLETRDGRRISVEFVSNVYQAGDKKVIQCNIRDISARKRADEAMVASEVRYRRLFETAKDGILILNDETGRIEDVNPFLTELLGYSHENFVGKQLWELGFFKDIAANQANFKELHAKTYIRYDDLPLKTSDGRRINVEFVSNVYRANGHKVIQCNIRDITGRNGLTINRPPTVPHFILVLIVAISSLILMTLFEATKQATNPNITIWQSHAITIIVASTIAALSAHFILRGIGRAYLQAIVFSRKQKRAEEALRRAHAELETRVQERTAELARVNATLSLEIAEHQQADEAMVASEVRYRRLFEAAKDGVLILNAETGRIEDVNPFLTELLGCSRETFVGKQLWELGFFKDIAASQAKFLELQAKDYIRYDSLPLETSDGRRIDVEFVSNAYIADGFRVIQCNIRDITARKQAEEALRRLRDQHTLILNSISEGIHGIGFDGSILFENPTAAAMLGYEIAELIGRPSHGTMHHTRSDGAPYPQTECPNLATMRDGLVRHTKDEVFWHKDGTSFPVEYTSTPMRDKDGRIIGVTVVFTDITERKRAEESHARLAMAVEQAAETIVITDTQGTIQYVNPAFEKSTGYTRAEALGQNPRILKSGKHDAAFYRRMWDVLTRGEVWHGHLNNKRKDGKLYEEETTISPVRDADGKVVNYVAAKRDVTHEMQLESQVRQSQKMEAIGTLAGGVAHDFNNMLAVISMETGLLKQSGGLSLEQAKFADEIGITVDRAAALTRQLLLFSRKEILQPRDLDLNVSIADMTKMLRRILGETIEVQLKLAAQPMFVHADAGMMDQVLMNLAVNARDAMLNGGHLVIETSGVEFDEFAAAQSVPARPGSFVCLSVSDSGHGIPPEILPRVFEPFFTTKAVGKGTGLGLATVFGIAQQHKGWINVYSEVGHGTTFRIYLPRLTGMTDIKVAQKMLATIPTGNETILLVEDEPALRISVRKALAQLGYHILEAPTGVKALEVWQEHRDEIQLLLTDLMMPDGMTGKDLAQRLLQEKPKLKVIYMSGYSAELLGKDFPVKDGVNFIPKPFQVEKLAQTIRDSLNQPG